MKADRRLVALTGAVVALALTLGVVVIVLLGGGGEESSGPPVSAEVARAISDAIAALPAASGSTDLEQMRSIMGPPDGFALALEEQDDGSTVRREEWYYYDIRSVFEFVDGALVANLPLDPADGLLVLPRQYDPQVFKLGVKWEEVAAMLGDTSAFDTFELEEEYEVDATIYVGNQLLLAFDDEGALFYVEAIPLEASATP